MNKEIIIKSKYEIDRAGRKFNSPIEKRVKKSKFALLLNGMTDQEIKALGYCLLVSVKVKKAIEYMHHTVENGVQLYALEKEYRKRFNSKQITEASK